ncbi:YhjD/YihY/BrkB family envelope integrity protein [Nocardioides sp. BP30]|uniref:YhjD/YihY/BrkB family envelope integrity protein n=1 Tax=Nocardioides sp. BP30 TaxID=3036374 RepID=UPI002469ACCD|nr:YhjD/YihY/BrkB family envelope integrity protein [Nocardioides sp. BP30]WGL52382.1 YhjD/YihY/BrkB family envelope integrity protein [Nocardioides sp. BP30]
MAAPTPEQQAQLDRALHLLPARWQRTALRLTATWPARVGLGTAWSLQRIEVFDRAMSVAAQLFTSVFPILILLASWFGDAGHDLSTTLGTPPAARAEVEAALKDSGSATFGVIGAIVVLASATSLARALARAFAAVWMLARPRSSPMLAWRWVAVVLAIALSLAVLRRAQSFADGIPPHDLWGDLISFAMLFVLAVFVPWLLLTGIVATRALVPGAALFGVAMLLARPFTGLWLSRSLETSAQRYGSIGVAFTYLAWLYVIAWIFLATAVIGQVLVTDQGPVGRLLAGTGPLIRRGRGASVDRVLVDESP